jgi:hypothetical protein
MMIPNPRSDKKSACKLDVLGSPTEVNDIAACAELCSAVATCKGFYGTHSGGTNPTGSYVSTDTDPNVCDEDVTDAKNRGDYVQWFYKVQV